MNALRIFLTFFLVHFSAFQLYADGTYYIGKDSGGMYFQTDRDGGWYIDRRDLKNFKPGETGTYTLKSDRDGTYLRTDKGQEFYIDLDAKEQIERETGRFNQEQDRRAGRKETPVIIRGNQVLVPVILGHRGREVEALLLLDTGASISVLHTGMANQLDVKQTQNAKLLAVGGDTIPAFIAKLNYITVGPFTEKNIYVGIIDHKNPSVSHQGLLGMNFLRNHQYQIDFTKQVIIWK